MRTKVLIIEDEELWSNRLKRVLESEGYFVKVATSMDEALQALKEDRFHFTTVDLNLDSKIVEVDEFLGWQVLDTIHKAGNRPMGIMVITSFPGTTPDENKRRAYEEYGVFYFMAKHEYSKEKLLHTISRHMKIHDPHFYDPSDKKSR